MNGSMTGKVVLCVGGGSGIGRATVEGFVGAGADVAVLDCDEAKVDDVVGAFPQALGCPGDATSASDLRAAVEATTARWGRLDVLAVFVGVFDHYRPLVDLPDESFDAAFDEIFAVNVKSALLAVRAAYQPLRASHGSIIVTLSSSSFYAGRGGSLYVATKFALRGAVVQLAHELAPQIRVNGVAPGGTVSTDLRGLHSLGLAADRLDDRPGRREGLEGRTPLQVALTPADHAGAYVFLVSDAAAGMTGEILRSDGGLGAR